MVMGAFVYSVFLGIDQAIHYAHCVPTNIIAGPVSAAGKPSFRSSAYRRAILHASNTQNLHHVLVRADAGQHFDVGAAESNMVVGAFVYSVFLGIDQAIHYAHCVPTNIIAGPVSAAVKPGFRSSAYHRAILHASNTQNLHHVLVRADAGQHFDVGAAESFGNTMSIRDMGDGVAMEQSEPKQRQDTLNFDYFEEYLEIVDNSQSPESYRELVRELHSLPIQDAVKALRLIIRHAAKNPVALLYFLNTFEPPESYTDVGLGLAFKRSLINRTRNDLEQLSQGHPQLRSVIRPALVKFLKSKTDVSYLL
ncbi:hypothetical protein MP638_007507 [Amoeboaphelidium occidentale]|nr:hypothetical protein MP638_007507 [Amoeboaphelidium occidentale]